MDFKKVADLAREREVERNTATALLLSARVDWLALETDVEFPDDEEEEEHGQ